MQMSADVIREITTLARESIAPKKLADTGDRTDRYIRSDGTVENIRVAPERLVRRADGLDGLDQVLTCPDATKIELTVDSMAVKAILDMDRDRITHAWMDLSWSDAWAEACRGFEGSPIAATRWLRTKFPGPHNKALLPALKKVDFKRTGEGRFEADHGKEAYGQSVEAQVQNIEAIPDSFRTSIRPLTNEGFLDIDVELDFIIDIAPQDQRIYMKLAPDVCRIANQYVTVQVLERVRKIKVDVDMTSYLGSISPESDHA